MHPSASRASNEMLRLAALLKSLAPPLQKLKSLHQKAFSKKYLLLTNVTISLSLSATGDALEQHYQIIVGEQERWDKRRTFHMGVSGMGVGVICHYWYLVLDGRMPGRTLSTVMKKIVLDQLFCSPLYISAFFITMGILERKSSAEVWEEMKEKAWKLYLAEWVVWPVAQFVNFCFLPPKYRVLYDNFISTGYDVYTANVKHSKRQSK